jgi:5-methylcytosine-specific restriction endonuclease McrA
MQYTKTSQLKSKRRKKKQKDLGKITDAVYKKVFNRDKRRCVVCGGTRGLECHHIVPRSRGGIGEPSNLCMLCKDCHYNKLHGQGDYDTKSQVFRYMIKLGYSKYSNDLEILTKKHNQLSTGRNSK